MTMQNVKIKELLKIRPDEIGTPQFCTLIFYF